jgi:hypothetical protein
VRRDRPGGLNQSLVFSSTGSWFSRPVREYLAALDQVEIEKSNAAKGVGHVQSTMRRELKATMVWSGGPRDATAKASLASE